MRLPQALQINTEPEMVIRMKIQIAFISVAALALLSCDKNKPKTGSADSTTEAARGENRVAPPAIAREHSVSRQGPALSGSRDTTGHPIIRQDEDPRILPEGTAPQDEGWEKLTAKEQIEMFNSKGIAGMPQQVSRKILADASQAESPEAQLGIINQQSAAWRHIHSFSENDTMIPEHMRRMLLEKLEDKHGESWINMASELDEQIAASAQVDKLRANGIPGMSADASEDLIIRAMERYGADYKAILSAAEQAGNQ